MMKTGAKFHRQATFNYAQALINLAKRKGRDLGALAEQAGVIRQAVEHEQARLRRFLEGPQIPTEDKMNLVRKVLGGQADELFVNLFCLLVKRDRSALASGVLEIFADMVASDQGIHYGRVTTAVTLDEAQRRGLQAALERFTARRLRITHAVDPSILGGVVFQYKDLLIDSSVRGRWTELRRRLEAIRVV